MDLPNEHNDYIRRTPNCQVLLFRQHSNQRQRRLTANFFPVALKQKAADLFSACIRRSDKNRPDRFFRRSASGTGNSGNCTGNGASGLLPQTFQHLRNGFGRNGAETRQRFYRNAQIELFRFI